MITIPAQHRDVCQPSSIGPTLELDLTATASQTVSKLFYNALSGNDCFIYIFVKTHMHEIARWTQTVLNTHAVKCNELLILCIFLLKNNCSESLLQPTKSIVIVVQKSKCNSRR